VFQQIFAEIFGDPFVDNTIDCLVQLNPTQFSVGFTWWKKKRSLSWIFQILSGLGHGQ